MIKRLATDAVMAGNEVIRNAKEMYEFVLRNTTTPRVEDEKVDKCYHFRRNAFWIDGNTISRERGRRALKAVDGTRRIHSMVSVKPGVVETRSLSCFAQPVSRLAMESAKASLM